jgi:membrane-bound lytic murein transglycosylase MltF
VEYEANKDAVPNLAVEKGLVVQYDVPYYLFVNKDNRALATRLEDGLRQMIKDGSFDEIFTRYHGAHIRRAGLDKRRVIHLENALLSADTPVQELRLPSDTAAAKH